MDEDKLNTPVIPLPNCEEVVGIALISLIFFDTEKYCLDLIPATKDITFGFE
jgi:hypothetical protein